MSKSSEKIKAYYSLYPWRKHLQYSRQRAKIKNWGNTLTEPQILKLWERDNASTLKQPSIDRIDSKQGYHFENCRFIERSENSRLGVLGRPTTDKQRETAKKNLSGWTKKTAPWNKDKKLPPRTWNTHPKGKGNYKALTKLI